MASTPDAQLLVIDLDHLEAGKRCLALGARRSFVLWEAGLTFGSGS
jgi:hypothetical protein